MKSRTILLVTPLALMMAVSGLFCMSCIVNASEISTVNATLQNERPSVDVSPESSGMVEIAGQINCTVHNASQVRVHLHVRSDIGTAVVTPNSFLFNYSEDNEQIENFTLTMRVPLYYSSLELPRVTLTGYFIQGDVQYNIEPVSHEIEIEPYYKIEAKTPPPEVIGAGEFVYFSVLVRNMGNVEDTFEFQFLNLEDLCDHQWTIATIMPLTLRVGETRMITVSAQTPQTWALWKNEVQPFNLRILSQQSAEEGGNVRCDITLLVRVRGMHIPGFSPIFAIIGIGLTAFILGKKRLSLEKMPDHAYYHPKDLYYKLSMSRRNKR